MCKHIFTKWVYVNNSLDGHYDNETFYQRICVKCGYVEEVDEEEYEWICGEEQAV